ncbi:MAG TPA: ribonuclease E/G [Acidocella sp.]|nr:ribonuclease E/G [Acidocella sp.]
MIAVSLRGEVARVALLDGDVLQEFWFWDLERPDGVGDVYTGRVDAMMPAMAGRFANIGDVAGFLPDSAGGKGLSLGTYVAVRVTRAAQGDKGPRLAVADEAPGNTPGLIRRGGGPLLDLCARFPASPVVVDDYGLIAKLRPALEGRMRHDAKAFDAVLEDEVAALAEPAALLPMGAIMHVTPAPAAVMIDIDAKAASDVPPLALNTAIIPEICRQIVLRNLSGGILIDFAGMKAAARERLAGPLTAALAKDFLKPEFLGFSRLGFAEIVRRRVRPPLHEVLH